MPGSFQELAASASAWLSRSRPSAVIVLSSWLEAVSPLPKAALLSAVRILATRASRSAVSAAIRFSTAT